MNKLNPIYILALLFICFIISYILVSSKKKEYVSSSLNYTNISVKVQDFKDYKSTWFNTKQVSKRIDFILKSSTFRKEKILKTQVKNIIKIKIESKKQRVLDKFLNRILNEKVIIKRIDIQKKYINLEIRTK
jgi:hypothetical protein